MRDVAWRGPAGAARRESPPARVRGVRRAAGAVGNGTVHAKLSEVDRRLQTMGHRGDGYIHPGWPPRYIPQEESRRRARLSRLDQDGIMATGLLPRRLLSLLHRLQNLDRVEQTRWKRSRLVQRLPTRLRLPCGGTLTRPERLFCSFGDISVQPAAPQKRFEDHIAKVPEDWDLRS
jgi:hypothetical protein